MKFLIAGFGSIGRRHLRNLLALDQHDILLLRSRKSTLPEDEIRDFPVETNIERALEHHPDGVVVANPTSLHLDVAIPAAKMGCHILMEKPVSNSMDRLDLLQEALQQGGGKLLMGFQYRFHPGLQKVKEILRNGTIGRLLSLRVDWGEYLPGWHPWEDYRKSYSARADLGGGVVLTLCHPLDYLRRLVGEVDSIYASIGHLSDLEMDVEDSAEMVLRFSTGVVGSVHLDYYRQPGVHRLEMTGSKGVLTWDNADGAVQVMRPDGSNRQIYPAPEGFERNSLFIDEMKNFIDVISKRADPECSLKDGIRSLQLVQGVYRSSAEKRCISGAELYLE